MYKEDTLLLEFAPAVEAGLSGLVLFYNSVLVPVGNFAAAYGWPAVKFVVGKGIATPLIGAAAGAYIVGQEGILKLMDYCDSRSNSPEQKAKFKKFARMVRLKAKMVKKYGAANLLRNKVLKRYKINKVVKDNPKVPKEVVGGTTEGSAVVYQERILNEAQIKFLYYMCNHNPNIKQDSLYIEACIRNPKKMNSLIEGTGMDNTRARILLSLLEVDKIGLSPKYWLKWIKNRGKSDLAIKSPQFYKDYRDAVMSNPESYNGDSLNAGDLIKANAIQAYRRSKRALGDFGANVSARAASAKQRVASAIPQGVKNAYARATSGDEYNPAMARAYRGRTRLAAGTVLSFKEFKKKFSEGVSGISNRNLYSLYLIDCARRIYINESLRSGYNKFMTGMNNYLSGDITNVVPKLATGAVAGTIKGAKTLGAAAVDKVRTMNLSKRAKAGDDNAKLKLAQNYAQKNFPGDPQNGLWRSLFVLFGRNDANRLLSKN